VFLDEIKLPRVWAFASYLVCAHLLRSSGCFAAIGTIHGAHWEMSRLFETNHSLSGSIEKGAFCLMAKENGEMLAAGNDAD
jgi:hypothetical protein